MNSFEAVVYIWWMGKDKLPKADVFSVVSGIVGQGDFSIRESQMLYSAAKVFSDVYSPELDERIRTIAEAYASSPEAKRFSHVLRHVGQKRSRVSRITAKPKLHCSLP